MIAAVRLRLDTEERTMIAALIRIIGGWIYRVRVGKRAGKERRA